jgi:DNA (cytosine-5)-methyltransferase 1
MTNPEHFDLFAGIGGFSLAAKWAGFTTIGFSEIDKFCCKILKKNFPMIENLGDASKLGVINSHIDLLTI